MIRTLLDVQIMPWLWASAIVLVFAIILWMIGAYNAGKTWVFQIHSRYRSRALFGVIVIALTIIGISMLITGISLEYEVGNWILGTGIVATFFAVFFIIFAFLNTLIIRQRAGEQIGSIPRLLSQVNKLLEDVIIDKQHTAYIYILDYAPALGIKHSENYYNIMKQNLEFLSKKNNVMVQAVFSSTEEVRRFHSKLGLRSERIDDIENFIKSLDVKETTEIAAWRTSDMGPLHLIMTDDIAFQYITLQKTVGEASKAVAFKSEEPLFVNFLEETFKYAIRQAITPRCTIDKDDLVLNITPQENVRDIKIYLGNDDQINQENNNKAVSMEWEGQSAISIPLDRVADNKNLKVLLTKVNGVESGLSNVVQIPTQSN